MFKLKQIASVAAAVAGLAFGMSPALGMPTIGFGAAVANGTDFDVDVTVSNLGGDIVSTYDLDVSYDDTALTFVDLAFSAALGGPLDVSEGFDDTLAGLVDLFSVSFLTDADLLVMQGGDSVTLATLTFTGNDFSSLAFVNWGTNGNVTNDVKGRGNRVIIPGQVPEPATFGLVGMALFAAGLARRRAT